MEASTTPPSNPVKPPDWYDLPVELWLEIFKYLSQPNLLFIIRHVCRRFNNFIFDPSLWKSFNMNEWKENASLKQLNLTSEETNHIFDNYEIDLLTMLLLVNGSLSSTDAFVPVIDNIHCFVKSISISTYGGDFELGEQQQVSLCKCTNLTSLNLAFCEPITPSILKDICQNCSKIDTLVFEGCRSLTDQAMEEISKFEQLEKLDISHCSGITDDGLSHITNMPCQLKHFISDGVLRLTDQGVIQLVCRQTKIEKLVLDGENLTDISITVATRSLENLTALEICFCSELSNRTISALKDTTRLKWLHLKKLAEWITTPVLTQLFMQDSMRHLHHLTLTDCYSVNDIIVNAVSIACPDLEHVQFDWCCAITDESIAKLIKGCRKLRRMLLVGLGRLRGSWLGSLDEHLPHLKMLDLSMCDEIGDEDLYQLIKRKPDLVAFSYFHEQVDTSSVEALIHFHNIATSPDAQSSNNQVFECAGSLGARVDF